MSAPVAPSSGHGPCVDRNRRCWSRLSAGSRRVEPRCSCTPCCLLRTRGPRASGSRYPLPLPRLVPGKLRIYFPPQSCSFDEESCLNLNTYGDNVPAASLFFANLLSQALLEPQSHHIKGTTLAQRISD